MPQVFEQSLFLFSLILLISAKEKIHTAFDRDLAS